MITEYNVGNYYGRLKTKSEDGKFFWCVENYYGDTWEEISFDLYESLMKYGEKKTMTEVLVWLFLYSAGGGTAAPATVVVERFKTKEQCEHVLRAANNMENSNRHACVQANILVPK